MPYVAIDNCYQCGKEVNLRDYETYRVQQDYRLMCEDCAKASEASDGATGKKAPIDPSTKDGARR